MFYSTGEFEPDDITRRLGVTPYEVARVGTSVGKSRIKRRNALWTLHSRLDPSVGPVDLHVADVLDQLDTNRAKFDALISEFGGVIEIVGLSENYGPPVSLDPEIVRRLAQYRLTLNVVRG
jgi:hypothetical protein